MGKADFSPVDSAIAGCLDKSKIIGILRVKNNAIHSALLQIKLSVIPNPEPREHRTLTASMVRTFQGTPHMAQEKKIWSRLTLQIVALLLKAKD